MDPPIQIPYWNPFWTPFGAILDPLLDPHMDLGWDGLRKKETKKKQRPMCCN